MRAVAASALHLVTVVAAVGPKTALRRAHCRAEDELRVAGGDADALPTPDWDAAVTRAVDSDALALNDVAPRSGGEVPRRRATS